MMRKALASLWQYRWWCVGTLISLLLLLAALVMLTSGPSTLPFIYALF
jgi:hypothetical protein